jgi:preprotein translocase subunit YajC
MKLTKTNLLCLVLILLATASCIPAPADGAEPMSKNQFIFSTVWFLALGMFGYYMLVTRPTVQKEEELKTMLKDLKKNDEVLVAGGIIGKVAAVKDEIVMVEIAPNTKIQVLSSQIKLNPSATKTLNNVDKKNS